MALTNSEIRIGRIVHPQFQPVIRVGGVPMMSACRTPTAPRMISQTRANSSTGLAIAYVYAVGNPEVGKKKNRYELAHQKGSGFGVVTIDTKGKTYTLDAFRFLVDATDGKAENQFPGWPLTIHQAENRGENVIR